MIKVVICTEDKEEKEEKSTKISISTSTFKRVVLATPSFTPQETASSLKLVFQRLNLVSRQKHLNANLLLYYAVRSKLNPDLSTDGKCRQKTFQTCRRESLHAQTSHAHTHRHA